MQTLFRAGSHTSAASDTLGRAGYFIDRKGYRTCFFTGHTGNTFLLLPTDLHKAEAVKPTINRSQRAEILAKGSIDLNRENCYAQQDPQFPEK